MSIQDERDLRGRLGGLLDSLEAPPAPVAHAMRRGRVIRMRRWVTAVAGVAVLAGGAVVLPKLIVGHGGAPMAARHYTVTVQNLGPTARGGVIGAGTINNKRWKIVLDNTYGGGCAANEYLLTCGWKYIPKVGPREVNMEGATEGHTQYQYGPVGSDVTSVVIRLTNGTELDLRPVSAAGRHWVAVALPVHAMVRAESFVGATEYQYALPYVASSFSEFVTWLNPGQPGLPRASAQVGSGKLNGVAWRETVSIGPWGYCTALGGGTMCIPTATLPQLPLIGKPLRQLTCGPLFPKSGKPVGAAGVALLPAGVKNVVLKFADGSRLRLVATYVGGTRPIGYALPNHPKVVSTLEYGFQGQLVGSAAGTGWRC